MCGIFGIFGHPDGKLLTIEGISSLQHRGQDATGIAAYQFNDSCREVSAMKGRKIRIKKDKGLVDEVMNTPEVHNLAGDAFIAHVRWPTQGDDSERNVQPHYTQSLSGKMAMVSNGDIVNIRELEKILLDNKVRIYSENDAEIICAYIHSKIYEGKMNLVESIKEAMIEIKGSYSALLMTEFEQSLYAFRDPLGIRPFYIGKKDGHFCFASETCALQSIDAELYIDEEKGIMGEVPPGSILRVSREGLDICHDMKPEKKAFCVFEYIYFSRPDSIAPHFIKEGRSFQNCRQKLGAALAKKDIQNGFDVDLVIPVPKGGIPGAIGYSNAGDFPLGIGIIENPRLRGMRTFIESSLSKRQKSAHKKYNFLKDIIAGKRVVVVDDSIVRGLTTGWVVDKLWNAGAEEVHVRIPSPPYTYGCHYGVETRDKSTLIANSFEEMIRNGDMKRFYSTIKNRISKREASSLRYLTVEEMFEALEIPDYEKKFCIACFNSQYPIPVV